jgi:hypothetical protein
MKTNEYPLNTGKLTESDILQVYSKVASVKESDLFGFLVKIEKEFIEMDNKIQSGKFNMYFIDAGPTVEEIKKVVEGYYLRYALTVKLIREILEMV